MSSNNPGSEEGSSSKRKRRAAGTPDPEAEVVYLSPKTLLESDRYVCEICSQGFQRDQNLQMHRRRHRVPWKLLKRETPMVKKRVFVCPEPSCLHHDPCHALGDLVGIKKHFRRKHCSHKQWICHKCSKGYAVQSDFKAHLKTCGTRGHSCDCGRVFSRVESFIEHQDACSIGRLLPESRTLQPTTYLSQRPSTDVNFLSNVGYNNSWPGSSLDLQLSAKSSVLNSTKLAGQDHSTQLQLSIGSSEINEQNEMDSREDEQLRMAMTENASAQEARQLAKRQIEMAEKEFANAKRIRHQARAELEKAQALKKHATMQKNDIVLEITCHSCRHKLQNERGVIETCFTQC
ncbi:SHOOT GRAVITROPISM 5-like [Olea europaea subsp. europaea]|uniref:SHOOT GRAVITROPISM 5-like n=1 Tax=Olea europaea subsp. europaea TaxID=158383 RepID=A0A8S0RPW1_OLEEU|nr:SHOOT GRAVITROPISM 5-like [Olea europaea subsp. europaea]